MEGRTGTKVGDLRWRSKAEEALQRLASLSECPGYGIVSTSREGRIATWNHGAERMFGYQAGDVLGHPISIVVPADARSTVAQLFDEVAAGRAARRMETVGLTKDGATIEIAFTVSAMRDPGGEPKGTTTILQDITTQKWTAKTLETTLEALESALRATKESEAHGRRFLADAAHQLRSPIAGIQACAGALLRGAGPSHQQQEALLANMVRETSRAARLMTGLLHLARLDQGQPLAPAPFDLLAQCSEEVDRVRVVAPHLDIVVDVGDLPDRHIECDPAAVQEILSNLLDNARRHAVSSIHVAVQSGNRGETVEVRVIDDGEGLAEAFRESAFERFMSLDGKGGSGLGLPIARGLARAHGGDVTYEGGGFLLRLPVHAERRWGPWGGQVAPPSPSVV